MSAPMRRDRDLDLTEQARQSLRQWGYWLQQTGGMGGIGVSGQTLKYRERIGTEAQGLVLMPDDEIAERVERILCRIKQQQPDIFQVLWLWYYAEATLLEIADETRVSRATVKSRRLIGETSVAAYWDAGYGRLEKNA